MKNTIIIAAIFFIFGVVVGSMTTCAICKKLYKDDKKQIIENQDSIVVEPIKGNANAIQHSNLSTKGKKISFNTKTKDAEIKTTINKQIIPEYKKWTQYVHGIQPLYSGIIYNDGKYRHVLGINYLYRAGWFAFGAGPLISWYIKDNTRMFGGGFTISTVIWS